MIIFDTDTISLAQHPDSREAKALHNRLLQADDTEFAATIISYEEQTRGWFSFMSGAKSKPARINAYAKLLAHLTYWQDVKVLPFSDGAYEIFEQLQSLRLRTGSFDLKIAAIALANNALLVSRNLQDFQRVPNLQVEDWTKF